MYRSRSRLLAVGAVLLILGGCGSGYRSAETTRSLSDSSRPLRSSFALSVQQAPPRHIQSIQLYRKGSPSNPPVIRLGTNEKLVLEFDLLGESSKQFKATVSHRSRNWDRSPLSPTYYLSGFEETYFSNGLASFSQRPSYTHYEFEFPNGQLAMEVSGNYLLEIHDFDKGELLFSLPFFVTEDEGSLNTRVETVYVRRKDLRAEAQPFSSYRYPNFIEFPQFDLSYFYVQNRFWGRAREVDIFSTASPGVAEFHLGREQAFLANYEFNTLDLRQMEADGRRILEVDPSTAPPAVILQRDVQGLSPAPRFFPDPRFGIPADSRSASYANVSFTLDASDNFTSEDKLYLVGDFNNWMVNELNRMSYKPESGLWKGQAFIKQGEYAYKYVTVRNGQIDDLALDQSFSFTESKYLTFVYYHDPGRNFDRLLKVGKTVRQ